MLLLYTALDSESTTRQRYEAEFTSNSEHFVSGDACESQCKQAFKNLKNKILLMLKFCSSKLLSKKKLLVEILKAVKDYNFYKFLINCIICS